MSARHFAISAALMGAVWVTASISLFAQFDAYDPKAACLLANRKEAAKVGQFVFRTYENSKTGDACLQVFRDGKIIFRRTLGNDGHYTLGQQADSSWKTPPITNGTDITGRGRPDMIVTFYTGGAHCCLLDYVFELQPEFKLLATLDAEDGDGAHFSLIENHYYFVANDWTFAYWRTSFAGSPAPGVVLRFVDDPEGGRYRLALDKMKRPEPKPEEWKKVTQETRAAFQEANPFSGGIGPALWGNMLDLIYRGHPDLAWSLFDQSWPSARKGKSKFLSDFCSQLKRSPYWPDLKETMPDMPAACVNAGATSTRK